MLRFQTLWSLVVVALLAVPAIAQEKKEEKPPEATQPEKKADDKKPDDKKPEAKKDDKKEPDTKADPNAVAFSLKFEKEKPVYQKMTTAVEQTIKVMGGSDITLNHELTYFFKWTPLNQDKEKWTVKQTIEGVKFKYDVAGQTIEFDSSDPSAAPVTSNPGLAEFFNSLVELEFTVTFAANSTVEKVDGRDEAIQKLATVNKQLEQLLKTVLSEAALKEMTNPLMGMTPPQPQAPGSSWKKESELDLGPIGKYTRTVDYTYKGKDATQKELDRVEVKPSITYKAAASNSEGLPFRIKSGKLETQEVKEGYILYDAKLGQIKDSKIVVVVNGDLEVTINKSDSKVNLLQQQTTTLQSGSESLMTKKE